MPSAMETLVHKSVERLGKHNIWRIVHELRALPRSCTANEARDALRALHVYMSDEDFETICHMCCVPASGDGGEAKLSVDTFVEHFLAVLPRRRRHVVDIILRKLDPERTGVISFDTLLKHYDAMRHPHVLSLVKSSDEITYEFLEHFAEADGQITTDEFVAYELGLSTTIPEDPAFELRCTRTFSLDRPKKESYEENVEGSRSHLSLRRSVAGTEKSHPLYATTNKDYGKDCAKETKPPKFGLSQAFTRSAPSRTGGGATSMNV